MARIVTDRGSQRYLNPNGGVWIFYHEFDLDCSCTLRVDENYMFRVGRMDLMTRIQQVADAHICEVEVFMVHTEAARQQRARQAVLTGRTVAEASAPVRFLGADVSVQPDATGVTMWASRTPEMLGSWAGMPRRRSPAEVDRAIRENPAPRQDPGAQVQAAARQAEALRVNAGAFRGVELTTVVVDEVSKIFDPKPEKKADPERPDRFMLIELD